MKKQKGILFMRHRVQNTCTTAVHWNTL